LIRPASLVEFVKARQGGQSIDEASYGNCLRDSVADVVKRQSQAGMDIVNDGEFGKSTSWSLYGLKRLSGFELRPIKTREDNPFEKGADRQRFKDFIWNSTGAPTAVHGRTLLAATPYVWGQSNTQG